MTEGRWMSWGGSLRVQKYLEVSHRKAKTSLSGFFAVAHLRRFVMTNRVKGMMPCGREEGVFHCWTLAAVRPLWLWWRCLLPHHPFFCFVSVSSIIVFTAVQLIDLFHWVTTVYLSVYCTYLLAISVCAEYSDCPLPSELTALRFMCRMSYDLLFV